MKVNGDGVWGGGVGGVGGGVEIAGKEGRGPHEGIHTEAFVLQKVQKVRCMQRVRGLCGSRRSAFRYEGSLKKISFLP